MPEVEMMDVANILEYPALYEIVNENYKEYLELLEMLRELANKQLNEE
jgi:hypothetical protein